MLFIKFESPNVGPLDLTQNSFYQFHSRNVYQMPSVFPLTLSYYHELGFFSISFFFFFFFFGYDTDLLIRKANMKRHFPVCPLYTTSFFFFFFFSFFFFFFISDCLNPPRERRNSSNH